MARDSGTRVQVPMTEQRKHFPEFYVTAPQPCPYLPGRLERKLFTHLTHEKSPVLVDNLLRGGFRRSQNIAYMPYCEGCQGCVSVRVLVDRFETTRSMRRVLETNRDLAAQRRQATPTSEQYALFRTYLNPDKRLRHAMRWYAQMGRRVWPYEIINFLKDPLTRHGPTLSEFWGGPQDSEEESMRARSVDVIKKAA